MATHIVTTHEVKSRLSELLREVEAGGSVIVVRNGHPVAKWIPWALAWTGPLSLRDVVDSDEELEEVHEMIRELVAQQSAQQESTQQSP